jgi:heme exporter protein A
VAGGAELSLEMAGLDHPVERGMHWFSRAACAAPGVPGPRVFDRTRGATGRSIDHFQKGRYTDIGLRRAVFGGILSAYPALRLVASGLAVRRGPRFLFKDLEVVLRAGEVMQLTGRNGSGKSTLLRLLAGFSPADQGSIRLEGLDEGARNSAFHYFGHREGLRAALSARENLAFLAGLLGGDASRIPDALSRLGIARLENLPVRVLSEGQRRRVALARLLVVDRPVWLLDEPLASLDAEAIEIVSGLISDQAARGGMAMVATHQLLPAKTATLDLSGRREVAA